MTNLLLYLRNSIHLRELFFFELIDYVFLMTKSMTKLLSVHNAIKINLSYSSIIIARITSASDLRRKKLHSNKTSYFSYFLENLNYVIHISINDYSNI